MVAYGSSTSFAESNANISGVSKPSSTAIGDVLVAVAYHEVDGGVSATIASTGDTWTSIHVLTNTTPSPDMTISAWICVVANASSTITVSGDVGALWRDFAVHRFTGGDATTQEDVAATENSGTGATATGLGLASGTANRHIVLLVANFDGRTHASWSSPLTERNDSGNVAMASGDDTAGTDTANKTVTLSSSSSWATVMLALRTTGGAPAAKAKPPMRRPWRYWTRRIG